VRLATEDGKDIGEIQQIQDRSETISEAEPGKQVAISIDKPVVGRHFNEGDILHVRVPEEHAKMLNTKFQDRLTSDEAEALKEFITVMRESSPFWAA